MATTIRPELSEKNKYYVERHRYYELKHFCLQYPIWKKEYCILSEMTIPANSSSEIMSRSNIKVDNTSRIAIRKNYYSERMNMIEKIAKKTDYELSTYIFKAVTEGLSYNNLKTKMDIPCGKDMYYDRYRRFFWLLSKVRD